MDLCFCLFGMSITFSFPSDRTSFETLQNLESIKRQLQRQTDSFSLWKCRFRVDRRDRGKYIYVRCRSCNASLRYKWDPIEEIYRLKHFQNQHNHRYQQNLKDQLQKFVKELPLSIELSTARKIATSKFHITPSMFYHAYSRLKQTSSTIAQFIRQLERRDYDISLDPFPVPEGAVPRIIVAISPEMKENFKFYGQTVSYDLTYNIIQDLSPEKRQYAVGIFTGVNCYNKIIPFGITITCDEKTEAFCKIFESFIEICGQPKSFITDQQSSMLSAFDRLKYHDTFKGSHLIDSFHAIRNFGKISERRDLQREVSDIIKEENPFVWEMKLDELQKKLTTKQQLKAFQLFYAKRRQVCFSQLPRHSFLIFNSSNSINEKMNDLVKCRIRSQKPYSQVLRTLVEFCQQLNQTAKESFEIFDSKLEDIFEDPELRLCRYLLVKRPMQEFIRQYVNSLSLKTPSTTGDIFTFSEGETIFECIFSGGSFDCSCGYTEKTGIGCRHMIWICRDLKFSYMETVHQRWKIDKQPAMVKQRRPSRSTRRR